MAAGGGRNLNATEKPMPTKNEPSDLSEAPKRKKRPQVSPEIANALDVLLAGYSGPEEFFGPDGLLKQLVGAVMNRAMETEMTAHLGYEKGQEPPDGQQNRRNGYGTKTLRGELGAVETAIPRDREGSFEPRLVEKHERSMKGFDQKILAMYARGMSTRDIQAHIQEIYGVDVSPQLVSDITEAVVDEVRAWQTRALEPVYLAVYLDALVVKIRDKGTVTNKSIYLAVGVQPDGSKGVLGMWLAATEGAKFWLAILSEIRQRGVQDILVICADGLKGLPDAVEASFPAAVFQTCIVHLVRSSVRFVPWKDRKEVCADLRAVYGGIDDKAAREALDAFDTKWGKRYPMVVKAWRDRWPELSPFLHFPPELRKAVYTTNAIEALNRQIRKVIKTKGAFPSDEAAMKLVYMAIRNAEKTWGNRTRDWTAALLQFAVVFGDRIPN